MPADDVNRDNPTNSRSESAPIEGQLLESLPLPEAGAIIWGTVHLVENGQVVSFNVTRRGFTLEEAIANLFAEVEAHNAKGGRQLTFSKPQPQPQPQPTQAASNPVRPPAAAQPAAAAAPARQPEQRASRPAVGSNGASNTAAARPPAQPQQPKAQPTQEAPSGTNVLHAKKVVFSVREDGRYECKFFAAGHEFPDITVVRAIEDLLPLLQQADPWTDKMILKMIREGQPSKSIKYAVHWQPGKANTKGRPYKDVVAIVKEDV